MINLKAIYGNKIYNRKAGYRYVRYIPLLSGFILDLVAAAAILWVFDVHWKFAFLKLYGILVIFGIISYILSSLISFINYILFTKNAITSEIKHYLDVFNSGINWHEIGTYDDFLLEASFNQTLTDDLRVLAAMNYGVVMGMMGLDKKFENRCYSLFNQIAPDYMPTIEGQRS